MTKYINGIRVGGNTKDRTRERFGRIVVERLIGREEGKKYGALLWECRCDCGNTKIVKASLLGVRTNSCGCWEKENRLALQERFTGEYETHGLSGTKEHSAWKGAKARVFNKKHPDYDVYSKIGMSESLANDFTKFLDEIGPIPRDMGGRVSVDRIDNTKGYIEGNIR